MRPLTGPADGRGRRTGSARLPRSYCGSGEVRAIGAASGPGRDARSLPPSALPSPLLVKTDQRSLGHVSQQQPRSSLPPSPASHELAAIATVNLGAAPGPRGSGAPGLRGGRADAPGPTAARLTSGPRPPFIGPRPRLLSEGRRRPGSKGDREKSRSARADWFAGIRCALTSARERSCFSVANILF